jgi:hypothetical protein
VSQPRSCGNKATKHQGKPSTKIEKVKRVGKKGGAQRRKICVLSQQRLGHHLDKVVTMLLRSRADWFTRIADETWFASLFPF